MRGKFRLSLSPRVDVEAASMRPAHYAREVKVGRALRLFFPRASMRPAHYAREVAWFRLG